MRRGELYRVRHPAGDTHGSRVFVVVSRQVLLDSRSPTAVCAPVFAEGDGLVTQLSVGPDEGLDASGWVVCDHLVSVPKAALTHHVGTLSPAKLAALQNALRAALELA